MDGACTREASSAGSRPRCTGVTGYAGLEGWYVRLGRAASIESKPLIVAGYAGFKRQGHQGMRQDPRRRRFQAVLERGRAAFLATFLILAAHLLSGCGGNSPGGEKVRVAADIVPLAMICRQVGGEHVEVEVLVPPGSSPHTYELTAGQVGFLAEADLLVVNGLGLVPWAEDVHSRVGNPDLVVVEAAEAVPRDELLPASVEEREEGEQGEDREEGREHALYDPHLWLDPLLAGYIVDAVEEGLIRVDPGRAGYYRERAARLRAEMNSLHEEIRRRTASFTRREFISFHASWTYFARRYDLRQAGVIEELPGKEPSAGEIAALVDMAVSRGVGAVFAEVQFSPRVAEAIAEESGGKVRVWVLDPLGDLDDPRKGDYCSLLRYNLGIMEEALR